MLRIFADREFRWHRLLCRPATGFVARIIAIAITKLTIADHETHTFALNAQSRMLPLAACFVEYPTAIWWRYASATK